MLKLLNSRSYHVWTDALHARELARQTLDDWDRGAYARWAINTAWSAFEMVCEDVLQTQGLGRRFKERFNEALDQKGIGRPDWGQGIWQRILDVFERRKAFTHVASTIEQDKLLAKTAEAEAVITTMREGMHAVCGLLGIPVPNWCNDDTDRGWQGPKKGDTLSARATVARAGVDPKDPLAVRLTYVVKGEEHLCDVLPPGADPVAEIARLVPQLRAPASAVRAYVGRKLVAERELNARGS